MARVDKIFQDELCSIINSGYSDDADKVRPKWEDGSPAHTRAKFGLCDTYDLSKEFPLLSLRPVSLEKAVDEILWIYQKKSNKVSELGSHIWDQWTDKEGTIGKAYGYQMSKVLKFPEGEFDQVDYVLWQLKNTPGSRRIMLNLYNHAELAEMNLAPCCYSCTFRVHGDTLHMLMNQRSSDMVVAHGWNVAQYAALQLMMAKASGLKPGLFTHMVADAHIYDRHIPIAAELLKRDASIAAPKVSFNPSSNDFYSFKVSDFVVEDYNPLEQIKNIPVAE